MFKIVLEHHKPQESIAIVCLVVTMTKWEATRGGHTTAHNQLIGPRKSNVLQCIGQPQTMKIGPTENWSNSSILVEKCVAEKASAKPLSLGQYSSPITHTHIFLLNLKQDYCDLCPHIFPHCPVAQRLWSSLSCFMYLPLCDVCILSQGLEQSRAQEPQNESIHGCPSNLEVNMPVLTDSVRKDQ